MNYTATATATAAATIPTDVVSELYAALGAGDMTAARALLAADVELLVPGDHPLSGSHRGPDAVLAFVAASRARTDDGEDLEVLDVLHGGDHVGVLCRVRASRGDRRLDNTTIHLLRVEDGRVTEIRFHNQNDAAVNAFWNDAR